MKLKKGGRVNIVAAEHVGGHILRLTFSDGHSSVVDFSAFLHQSQHPEIRRYLDSKRFRRWQIADGNLMWGDYAMCFSIADLYEGSIDGYRVDQTTQRRVAERRTAYGAVRQPFSQP